MHGSGLAPIPYTEGRERLDGLVLGYRGERVEFSWRPYAERKPDHRADYDRLAASIQREGIRSPLITFRSHVLIGMRRAEIGLACGIETVRCWRIMEDVHEWHGDDLHRLDVLKAAYGATTY